MRSDISTAQDTSVLAPCPGQRAPAEVRVEERRFTFEGFDYHCRVVHQESPRTEPLVLLGGSSQNRYAWLRHQKWLAAHATVITVDLPGYGEADFLPAVHGLDFLSANVRHMLEELDVSRANLVGSCFGGAIALRFAQHHPYYVAKLGLVGMTKVIPDDYAAAVPRWARMLELGDRAQIAAELVQRFMSPPGTGLVYKHQVVSRLLYGQFMAQSENDIMKSLEHNARLMSHDWYRDLPVPAVPALVFTGEYDTLCTPAMGRDVAAALPAAAFTTIKHADHLSPVERMPEFCALITRFCTDEPFTDLPYTNPVEWLGTARRPETQDSFLGTE
ncbi:alpha/beta fold hydrolase [Actinacidiphila paucisporea]|uniref:Pimeloyl-ACP methyl ester carboxylesterase n=1 Tax=Actinacidiphila paucisporea TaxID=310782 RepID=A0A1M7CRQ0_9ACTN|nr:alpha/beta hydrolase [Actinacidiphila paucisporea]SHL69912.1 Pimeloyl-ACP methyl ester carboxylesterase [Actinacidiphila paucisporea]